jgi:hypothetical protein
MCSVSSSSVAQVVKKPDSLSKTASQTYFPVAIPKQTSETPWQMPLLTIASLIVPA